MGLPDGGSEAGRVEKNRRENIYLRASPMFCFLFSFVVPGRFRQTLQPSSPISVVVSVGRGAGLGARRMGALAKWSGGEG